MANSSTKTTDYLALDLGAESGRGLLGRFDGETLVLDELHRFPNGPVRMLDTLHWDVPRLFDEMKTALQRAIASARPLTGSGSIPGASTSGWSAAARRCSGTPCITGTPGPSA